MKAKIKPVEIFLIIGFVMASLVISIEYWEAVKKPIIGFIIFYGIYLITFKSKPPNQGNVLEANNQNI